MKTTHKTFLLLCLCTLFGFLVYVDFMGGVRGDSEESAKSNALEANKKSRSYLKTNSSLVLAYLEEYASKTGRAYDNSVLYKAKQVVKLLDKSRKHIEINEVDTKVYLQSIFEELEQKDTILKLSPFKERLKGVSWEDISEASRKEYALNILTDLEMKIVEVMASRVGFDGTYIPDYIHATFELLTQYYELPTKLLSRSRKRATTHELVTFAKVYDEDVKDNYQRRAIDIFPQNCKAKIKVNGSYARVVLNYSMVQEKAAIDSWGEGVRLILPDNALPLNPFVLNVRGNKEFEFIDNGQQYAEVKEKEETKEKFLSRTDSLMNKFFSSPSAPEEERFTDRVEVFEQVRNVDTLRSIANRFSFGDPPTSYQEWAKYKKTNEWIGDNYFYFSTEHDRAKLYEDALASKLITYDLPLTPTPEGYVLDWPFPTDLYPLELELEVFPAPGQQLVISEDYKGEDLPQGGKRFFWKKFPSKNLHLALKGETTVVLQSEAQENEEPAFSLSARADLPQEKAAPQHTAFLLDASERTKAQRFGEYAALLLQLLEKAEKYIPSFSLFYFQDEAKAYGKALPNTPAKRQKLRRFLQNLKPQGEGTLEEALSKFADFAPKGSRTLLLAAGNIHHGDVHEMTDSLGNQGVKIHPNSPMAHAAPLLQKGLRCYTLEDGIAEQHHPLLNYIAHASGGQRLRFHGLKEAENVMQKLLSQPWEIEKIEVKGTKDLLFSKQIRALLLGQNFQLNGKGQWPGTAKIHLRSTDGRRKTLPFEAETLSSPLPPREHARALLEVYAAKGNTPETRFHEATLRKKYNIAGRFFRFSNQLEEAYASPSYMLLKEFDPNWRESTLEKDATLQNYTDAFPNYSPRRVLFAALNRYAIAHEKAFSPEEKELFLNLPESAFENQEVAQWVARFEKATPAEKEVAELKEILATLI